MQTVEIPLSKTKMSLMILGSAAFVALGVWLWTVADVQTTRPPIVAKVVGAVCVAFFGACLAIGLKSFFNKRPGLTIDANGLLIFSGFTKSTFVSWEYITGIGEMEIHRNKIVLIFIDNVEEMIAAQPNKMAQKLMRANTNMSGTPVSLSSNILQLSHKELMSVLEKALADSAKDKRAEQTQNF